MKAFALAFQGGTCPWSVLGISHLQLHLTSQNSFFSLLFPVPLRTFEWAGLNKELLKHFEKCSEGVGTWPSHFAQAGQCEAALWLVFLVLGDASSLSSAQYAA